MVRPRAFDTDATLDVLVDRFWDGTFATTSTDDLCRLTGLSRSSLYNAFGSKRELFAQVVDRYAAGKAREREEVLALDAPGDVLLRRFAQAVLEPQWDDPSRRACLGITASIETGPDGGDLTERLERNARSFDAALETVLARGQRDGSIDDRRTPAELAWLVHAALDGLQVRSRVHPDRAEVDRCLDTLLSLLAPHA